MTHYVRVPPTELIIAYDEFIGDIGLFRDTLYGALILQFGYDKSMMDYFDCERRMIDYSSTDDLALTCIQWITGVELINLLNPICVT